MVAEEEWEVGDWAIGRGVEVWVDDFDERKRADVREGET